MARKVKIEFRLGFTDRVRIRGLTPYPPCKHNDMTPFQPPDRPDSIPSNPSITYKDSGWISMPDWIGTNRASYTIDSKFWSFKRARDFARKLELQSYLEWRDYTQGRNQTLGPKLKYISSLPHVRYKTEGWIDYPDGG